MVNWKNKEEVKKYHLKYNRDYRKNNVAKMKAINKNYREKNKDKIKESQEKWRTSHPDYQKAYLKNNREHIGILKYEWAEKNPSKISSYYNPEKKSTYNKMKYKEDKTKSQTQSRTNYLQKMGQIKCNESCIVCNGNKNMRKHHEDYSAPKEIIPLCNKCHITYHRGKTPHATVIRKKIKNFGLSLVTPTLDCC